MSKKSFSLLFGIVALGATTSAYGQRWEFSGGGGASFYTSRTITGPNGSADASFKPGYGFNAAIMQVGNRFGGGIRYAMNFNDIEPNGYLSGL